MRFETWAAGGRAAVRDVVFAAAEQGGPEL